VPLYVVIVTVAWGISMLGSVTMGQVAPISELRALKERMGEAVGRLLMLPCLQWQAPKTHLCARCENCTRGEDEEDSHTTLNTSHRPQVTRHT